MGKTSSSSSPFWKATVPRAETAKVGFPYFGGIVSEHFPNNQQTDVLVRTVPVATHRARRWRRDPRSLATVFDLQVANYGVARGLKGRVGRKELRR